MIRVGQYYFGKSGVKWVSFKSALTSYAKAFYETTQEDVESGVYDASKLRSVIAALLEECTGLAAAMLYSKS